MANGVYLLNFKKMLQILRRENLGKNDFPAFFFFVKSVWEKVLNNWGVKLGRFFALAWDWYQTETNQHSYEMLWMADAQCLRYFFDPPLFINFLSWNMLKHFETIPGWLEEPWINSTCLSLSGCSTIFFATWFPNNPPLLGSKQRWTKGRLRAGGQRSLIGLRGAWNAIRSRAAPGLL